MQLGKEVTLCSVASFFGAGKRSMEIASFAQMLY